MEYACSIKITVKTMEENLVKVTNIAQVKGMMSNLENTKLIIVSGEADDRIRKAEDQLTADAVIKKPIKINELKEKIKALCIKE